jgi:hypothetical protein
MRIDLLGLTMKIEVLKVTDRDSSSDGQYFTIKTLRDQILNEWYDIWGENHQPHEQDYTKEQIKSSDEDMFSWLNSWGYDVEVVLIITEKDIC